MGIIGATSLVGQCLLPLLVEAGCGVKAFSRRRIESEGKSIQWMQIPAPVNNFSASASEMEKIHFWICVAPLWILPNYFSLLEKYGAQRIIALSSTSRFTKCGSSDAEEKVTARMLTESEDSLQAWAQANGVSWVILRPTLIYGLGQDKNISEIVRLIRRFGFFPVAGQAKGLRQPVHAGDVALACISALDKTSIVNRTYNISGSETLTYREMISRLFTASGYSPRLISVPLWLFRLAAAMLGLFPHYRHWNIQMAKRMNNDLVFDHTEAIQDLNYSPRAFHLTSKDLPKS